MSNVEKRTFSLPAEQAAFIDARVASGAFASASEVVRAGLRALQERDAAVERWLREEVAPTYDAMKADPARALSGDELLAPFASAMPRAEGECVRRRQVDYAPEADQDFEWIYDAIARASGPTTAFATIVATILRLFYGGTGLVTDRVFA